jgi:two-component system sensor histidine kinase KdpD
VALVTFLTVSFVASNLSSAVRLRERDALNRHDEMARLFDLSRDVILMTESHEVVNSVAQFIARRFALDFIAICLPRAGGWDISRSGDLGYPLDQRELTAAFTAAGQGSTAGANQSRPGAAEPSGDTRRVRLAVLRFRIRPVGLLATAGRSVEAGTSTRSADSWRSRSSGRSLEERKTADLARQSEELKSALLASLGHDLRTPLTAIRVAASNLQASWLSSEERHEQSVLVVTEVERLTRLFQNILDMARIDAGAVSADARWVDPSEIIAAARELVSHAVRDHPINVTLESNGAFRQSSDQSQAPTHV